MQLWVFKRINGSKQWLVELFPASKKRRPKVVVVLYGCRVFGVCCEMRCALCAAAGADASPTV